jgi:hypothetical protein
LVSAGLNVDPVVVVPLDAYVNAFVYAVLTLVWKVLRYVTNEPDVGAPIPVPLPLWCVLILFRLLIAVAH